MPSTTAIKHLILLRFSSTLTWKSCVAFCSLSTFVTRSIYIFQRNNTIKLIYCHVYHFTIHILFVLCAYEQKLRTQNSTMTMKQKSEREKKTAQTNEHECTGRDKLSMTFTHRSSTEKMFLHRCYSSSFRFSQPHKTHSGDLGAYLRKNPQAHIFSYILFDHELLASTTNGINK